MIVDDEEEPHYSPDHERLAMMESGDQEMEEDEEEGSAGKSEDDFEKIKVLGKGSYGKVFLVRQKGREGDLFAMKVLKKDELIKRKQVDHTKAERRILQRVKHPFVVGLYSAFQTAEKLFFVLHYCPGGELFFYLQNLGGFPEHIVRFYASNILLGLEALHSENVVYRE